VTASFSAADARDWTRGEILRGSPDAVFAGVSIDSRSVAAGCLFVAIAGPRHDGHDHVLEALRAGAAGCLIERGRALPAGFDPGRVALAAADTTRALGDLAAGHRARFHGPVVAITGSNGKTSTKEMTAAILGARGPCLHTEGNLNNQYGLPLTLLRRSDAHACVVVELGTNHPGEIARLAEIARPTVGVITNVGTAHIEFLGSREGIAREKGDLLPGLPESGVAVLNADDPLVLSQAARTRARVVRFGRSRAADVRAEDVAWRDGALEFRVAAPGGGAQVRVAGLSEATVMNALAACAAALAAGAPAADLARGLAAYRPVHGRLEPVALPGDVLVIDDTYNANPQSLEVALRELATGAACARGRHVAVLGDMGELGSETRAAHRAAGSLAASLGVDHLYAVGAHATQVADGALAAGLAADRVHAYADWEPAAAALADGLQPGDRVLVKGSRSMRMERIVERIAAAAGRQR
jgi:UDP-N-acetylmuramoyl-tripeptide--D-alanyl-D-alanine ligase